MNERRDNVVRLPRQQQQPIELFRPFYASEMQGRTPAPRQWLVDGVLLRRTVMLFAGPPKIGKSLLLQQMLTALAIGDNWLGRQTVRCKTFGLFCEDAQEELERRQVDINVHHDRDPADFETDFSWASRDGKEALLVEFERFTDRPKYTNLFHQLVAYVKDEGIQVIGLDTAAAVFGGNENMRTQTTRFLRDLQRLALEIDGAIILNAHPSRSNPNSYSGNTAWLASVRAGLSLGRPVDFDPETGEPRNIRVLRGLGSNYGGGVGAERLEYQDGVFVRADPEHREKRGPLSLSEMTDLRYRLLTGLRRQLQNGAKVPADVMQPGSMPNRARRSTDPQINRVGLNDLYLAQEALIDTGQIVRVEVSKKCLIRPHDGPYYDDEQPWLPDVPKQRKQEEQPSAAGE
jgi:hypothetical protein